MFTRDKVFTNFFEVLQRAGQGPRAGFKARKASLHTLSIPLLNQKSWARTNKFIISSDSSWRQKLFLLNQKPERDVRKITTLVAVSCSEELAFTVRKREINFHTVVTLSKRFVFCSISQSNGIISKDI